MPVSSESTALAVGPRLERAMVALAVHAQQIDDRLGRLERRLDEAVDATLDLPTTEDVMAVRVHTAKVAAEVARVHVELQAEIAEAVAGMRPPTPHERRVHAVAETIVDLSDRLDTTAADRFPRAATA